MADTLPGASEIIRGLYLITDASGARGHEEIVREAIAGGARLIQFRDKYLPKDEFRDMACEAQEDHGGCRRWPLS